MSNSGIKVTILSFAAENLCGSEKAVSKSFKSDIFDITVTPGKVTLLCNYSTCTVTLLFCTLLYSVEQQRYLYCSKLQ